MDLNPPDASGGDSPGESEGEAADGTEGEPSDGPYEGLNGLFLDAGTTVAPIPPSEVNAFHPFVDQTDLHIFDDLGGGISAWVEAGRVPIDLSPQIYGAIYGTSASGLLETSSSGPFEGIFRVNKTGVTNVFAEPAVAGTSDHAAIVWPGAGNKTNARIFAPTTGFDTTEFTVSPETHRVGNAPDVDLVADGFVFVWDAEGDERDQSGSGVFGRIVSFDGESAGDTFLVNTHTELDQENPVVATLDDGSFVVVWDSLNQDGSSQGVYGQRFTADGTKSGDEFLVNTFTDGIQEKAAVSSLSGSGFVVVWESDGPGFTPDIYGRVFAAEEGSVVLTPAADGLTLSARSGPVFALGGDDSIVGGAEDDSISGQSGNDRLLGNAGNDTLDGGVGTDSLNGGAGDDLLIGGTETEDRRDTIYGGGGNDTINAGHGNDLAFGQDGDDVIAGGFGADELFGQNGNDVITGSAFSDLVFGGAGDDFVNGGFGFDRINGGIGADKFYHAAASGHGSDWVQDYGAADGDVLVFGGSGASVSDFVVRFAHTATPAGERSGNDDVQEAFVNFRGQTLWALVDGEGQAQITLQIGAEVFDLLA